MKKHLLILTLALTACATTPKEEFKKASAENKVGSKVGFDAELTQYQYPFPVKFFNFRSQEQDLKMAYMDIPAGRPSAKVIVMLHGKNFPGAYFEQLILGLNQEGYRVIVPDQIGFGKSSKPKNYQYSFQTLALNTKNLLNSLGVEKYFVLGHSMGGMVATRFALMYPDSVTKLFLVNPIGLEDWKTMTSYRSVDDGYKAELASNAEKVKQYQLESYYDGKWKSDYDKWLEIPTGWVQGPDYPVIAWNAALTSDMIFTQPVYYEFKNLKAPTVLIIGDRDRTAIGKAWAPEDIKNKMGNYPVMSQTVAKMIPKSKLITLKGLGHMPFIEDFEAFWKVFVKQI
ncbi:alpha/beta hydrolase [Bdellovibrio bacteriovorus]|uniref:Alpha/beta hydrolase n=1 Tax=Bdellovibrio bacteriovorus TaxID=959 RepID=A0A150WE42_BDEBC|nr:alpha/beta hydrolase [Bdellovibrio bacteriovorus]KYG61388.1 alpha/beta hydrolase [Bdellovibrio bacteriovorus]